MSAKNALESAGYYHEEQKFESSKPKAVSTRKDLTSSPAVTVAQTSSSTSTSSASPTSATVELGHNVAVLQTLSGFLGAVLQEDIVVCPQPEDTFDSIVQFFLKSDEAKLVEKMTELRLALIDYLIKMHPDVSEPLAPKELLDTVVASYQGSSLPAAATEPIPTAKAAPVAAPAPPPPPPPPPAPLPQLAKVDVNIAGTVTTDSAEGDELTTPIDQIQGTASHKAKKVQEQRSVSGTKGGCESPSKSALRTPLKQLDGNEAPMSISQMIAGGATPALKRTKMERSPGGTPRRSKKVGDGDLLTQALKKKFEK